MATRGDVSALGQEMLTTALAQLKANVDNEDILIDASLAAQQIIPIMAKRLFIFVADGGLVLWSVNVDDPGPAIEQYLEEGIGVLWLIDCWPG